MTKSVNDDITTVPIYQEHPPQVLIPLMPGSDNDSLLTLAHQLSESRAVLLVGVVPVPPGKNLSTAANQAQELRRLIEQHTDRVTLRAKARIRVSYTPWDEIRMLLAKEKSIDLLVLNWPHQLEALHLTPAEILSDSPCDVAIVRGAWPDDASRILVPMHSCPHGEGALRMALELAYPNNSHVTALRLNPTKPTQQSKNAFAGIRQILSERREIEQQHIGTANEAEAVLEASQQSELIVLGTAACPTQRTTSFGEITDLMLRSSAAAVMALIKSKFVCVMPEESHRFETKAISVQVDRWFAQNSFDADEFANLNRLMALKEERGLTISLALPALNEEKTIGEVIRTAQRSLMQQFPLLDEIVLMDSNSTDRTLEIASDLGIPVYIHQEILPQYGARVGKGEALWKSLYVTKGDLIVWVDTDITNFHPHFIYGLVGALLYQEKVAFVKGFYRRPLKVGKIVQPGGGGRVTELTVRPLLNLFYPGLSGIIQPLAGEYGGHREVLEQLTFTSGYGVEISLLIDVFEKFKLASIAQVDMKERIHKNQSLHNLSKMAFAIVQTLFKRRYGLQMLPDISRTMKNVRYEAGHFDLKVDQIEELERPPMIEIPEYRRQHGRSEKKG